MKRIEVNSSLIAVIGYDSSNHTLEIEFKSGAIWWYFIVSQDTYDELMAAKSVGTYFLKEIKGKCSEEQVNN